MKPNKNILTKQELDQFIEKEHEAILHNAKCTACSLAEASIPGTELAPHTGSIKASYHSLSMKVKTLIQAATEKMAGALDVQHAESAVFEHERKLHVNNEEIRMLNADRRKIILNYSRWKYWRVIIAETILFLSDIGLNAYAFSLFGGALGIALFVAIGFAGALAIVAVYVPRRIEKISQPETRTKAWKLFVLVMIIVLGCMATLRAITAVTNGTSHSHPLLWVIACIISFTVISSVIFFAAVSIALYGLPTEEQKIAKQNHDRFTKRIDELEKENKGIDNAKQQVKNEKHQILQQRVVAIGNEEHYLAYIESLCNETLGAFYNEFAIKQRRTPPLIQSPHI